MSFLSKAFRRKPNGLPPWAALDQESLRISAAMQHVQDHGNLDSFPGNQNEKLALMLTASRQGLVTWDREHQRYELTSLGRERLGMGRALRQSGGPMNLRPASATPVGRSAALGSGAIVAGIAGVALGAAAMALLPGSSSKAPPRDQAAVTTAAKPADTGSAPPQTQAQAPVPRPEEASVAPPQANPEQARNAPAPASPKAEPPKPEAQQQAGMHPGQAGAIEGALAQQLTLAAEPAPAASGTTANTTANEPKATNETAAAAATEPKPPAPSQAAPATGEVKPAPAPKQPPPRRSAERARAHEPAPAPAPAAAPAATPAPPAPARTATSQSTPADVPAAQATPAPDRTSRRTAERTRTPPPPAPDAANPEQPGFAQSTGESGRATNKSSRDREAATEQTSRRTAERTRTPPPAPDAANPEQPGFAQSTGESGRATNRSSRNRQAATEQRQSSNVTEPRQSWSDSKRKSGKSRRERVEQDEGEPEQGVIVRRSEDEEASPFVAMRRYRGEPSRRSGGEEERPGFAYREAPSSPFGNREGPRRFGLFDWLFR